MTRKFKREDRYDEKILLIYVKRHLKAAKILFELETNIWIDSIYSAGYLLHLAVELILEAFSLKAEDYFIDLHDLKKLVADAELSLEEWELRILENLEYFKEFKYPPGNTIASSTDSSVSQSKNMWGEIGEVDYINTIKLITNLIVRMKNSLKKEAVRIFREDDLKLKSRTSDDGKKYILQIARKERLQKSKS